jgi:hypothetical protein
MTHRIIVILAALSLLLACGCGSKSDTSIDGGTDADADADSDADTDTDTDAENTAAACQDGIDNDGDGLTDCDDDDCEDFAFCQQQESDCSDGVDNDGDGDTDCADDDCSGQAACQENTYGNCQDGIDNDLDGLTDCDDEECEVFDYCEEHEQDCGDGVDNDDDGLTDCDDTEDCAGAPECGGNCYELSWLAPAVWGAEITEAADDEDPETGCVQYTAIVEADEPLAGTEICVFVDDAVDPAGCGEPSLENSVEVPITLCQGEHTLHAEVGPATNENWSCEPVDQAVTAWENPSCQISSPTLSTEAASPTPWTEQTMDVEITTGGAHAELWVGGLLKGDELVSGDVAAFDAVALGDDGVLPLVARCYNPGDGTGDSWSVDYYARKDTQAPVLEILWPADGAIIETADCPFTVSVEVSGLEAGQDVCVALEGYPDTQACAAASSDPDSLDIEIAECVEGVDLTLTAAAVDEVGNLGTDSVTIDIGSGIYPTVNLEWPADGAVYSASSDGDPGTDALDAQVIACTNGDYNPADIELSIDGSPAGGLNPQVAAASCGSLSHTITFDSYAFSQAASGLQTPHSVAITVSDGINVSAPSSADFQVDTQPPTLLFLDPGETFFLPADDYDTITSEFEVYTRVQVAGLESGLPVTLAVTNGGSAVGESPYSADSTSASLSTLTYDWSGGSGVVIQSGQNELAVNAADDAGNAALEVTHNATLGNGTVTFPAQGALLAEADDCDGTLGADYEFPVTVQVPAETTAGTEVRVAVSSSVGGWSYQSAIWSTDCSSDPCTNDFCVEIPVGEVEQSDIAVTLTIDGTPIPGTPDEIAVDLSAPEAPAVDPFVVLERRAAQVRLSWSAVEDDQSGPMDYWEIRCAVDETLDAANWDSAMVFLDATDDMDGAAEGATQIYDAHDDHDGNKIRAGHTYSCGIRGVNQVGLASAISTWGDIGDAEIGFKQLGGAIEGYTQANYSWFYWPSMAAAGNLNGDKSGDNDIDDFVVGYGGNLFDSLGNAAAIFFGSDSGAPSGVDLSCADASFGAAAAGLGNFNGDDFDDVAIAAPDEGRVYVFYGSSTFGSAAIDCADADLLIQGPSGAYQLFGNSLSGIGDFDNDGLDDIAIGSPYEAGSGSLDGAAYIALGRDDAVSFMDLTDGTNSNGSVRIAGPAGQDDNGGGYVFSSNFDKMGGSDIVVAAPFSSSCSVGLLYGFSVDKDAYASSLMNIDWNDMDTIFDNPEPAKNSRIGLWGLDAIDFDGDGWLDLMIGDERGGTNYKGRIYVHMNNGSGAIDTDYTQFLTGVADNEQFGLPISIGYVVADDLPVRINGLPGPGGTATDQAVVAGARETNSGTGFAALFYGGFSAGCTTDDADVLFPSPTSSVSYHWSNWVGDIDGDGFVDLAVGDTEFGTSGRFFLYR